MDLREQKCDACYAIESKYNEFKMILIKNLKKIYFHYDSSGQLQISKCKAET